MSAIAVSPIAAPVRTRRKKTEGILSGTGEEGSQKSTVNTHADIIKRPSSAASMLNSGDRTTTRRIRADKASVEAQAVLSRRSASR